MNIMRKWRHGYKIWVLFGILLILTSVPFLTSYISQYNHFSSQYSGPKESEPRSEPGREAPIPSTTFSGKKCSNMGEDAPEIQRPNQWSIPSIGQSARFTDDTHGVEPIIPDAPDGIRYGPSMPLGSPQGATVLVGHVDYAPGQLSPEGGQLSPWGHLHSVTPCGFIQISDSNAKVHEFRVTALYIRDRNNLPEAELFRSDGPPAVYFITCSGPSIKDAGKQFQFNYKYNLIVKAEPVN